MSLLIQLGFGKDPVVITTISVTARRRGVVCLQAGIRENGMDCTTSAFVAAAETETEITMAEMRAAKRAQGTRTRTRMMSLLVLLRIPEGPPSSSPNAR